MNIERHSDALRMVSNGTPVELASFDDVLEAVVRRLSVHDAVPLALGSVNLDHLHHFRGTEDAVNRIDTDRDDLHWAFLADGAPIVHHAEKLTGLTLARVAGSDLLPQIVQLAAQQNHSIGFLGGTPRMHERLRFVLRGLHPELRVAGLWAPEAAELADPVQSSRIAAQISAASVDVLVVGLGKPRQELWIAEHGLATGARVLLAFGAAADFLAGESVRAPEFFQRNGLEWFYRLVSEPKRLSRRYLVEGPRAFVQLRRSHIEAARRSPLTDTSVTAPIEQPLLGGLP